jgi:outer membrane protein assembly factor BamB
MATSYGGLMPRDPQLSIFVGIKNCVVALDDRTGVERWRTALRSSDHVAVLWDGEALLAASGGEVWRLDPERGEVVWHNELKVVWHNELKGLGRGLVSLASSRRAMTTAETDLAAQKRRRDVAAATAGG